MMLDWIVAIFKAIGAAFGIYKNVQADNVATTHDNLVRDDQSKTDAIQGESNALEQVDSVNAAVDAGGVRYSDDPENRNR
jgi:hypothetical protein